MKRSRRVVLTMMGTAAVGAVSMGFVRRSDCGPGQIAEFRARSGRPAAGILPRQLWRLRRRAASAARHFHGGHAHGGG